MLALWGEAGSEEPAGSSYGVSAEGWIGRLSHRGSLGGGVPTPLVVLCGGILYSTLVLLQDLRNGSWVLAFLCLLVHSLPKLSTHVVIFSPL